MDGTVIIGAGPAGLGCARRLQELGRDDWQLFEAQKGPGGLAGSVVDDAGFTWDLGGHVQFSHYEYFDDLMDELLGPEGWLYHERESWVRMRDRFIPYPLQLNLHRLPEAEMLECLRGLLDIYRGTSVSDVNNFDQWLDATFGPGLCDVFMRPYNFKVWAYPASELAWHWIGERVAVPDVVRVVENAVLKRDHTSWGPNNRFRYPKTGGTGATWNALAQKLPAERQHYGATVVSLDTARKIVRLGDGAEVPYRELVSTIPLDRLVGMSDLDDLKPVASGLLHSSVHVVGVGLHGAPPTDLQQKCWMYFPEDDCPFYRVTLLSRYSPANVPGPGYWSLMAEVSESTKKPVDGAQVVEDTVRGMHAAGLLRPGAEVASLWHTRLEYGYPTPSLARDAILDRVLPALEERQVYSRGRFGIWKYEVSNQDHTYAQGREVANRLVNGTREITINDPNLVNSQRGR